MYKLQNIFGMIKVFDDLQKAFAAYEEECNFCEFCGLYDFYTGETIAESW